MEFQYDFKRKSKHKISNIEKLLKKDCILKMKKEDAQNFVMINGEAIKTNSKKLQAFFLKDYTCECCGKRADFFALEQTSSGKFVLNLYAEIDGQEVLMLKELKTPARLGGLDVPENWMVVCDKCYLEKEREIKHQKIQSGNYDLGYVIKLNDLYLNIKKSQNGIYSVRYVTDIEKAKTYKDRGLMRNRIQKMINSNLLPDPEPKNYQFVLKNLVNINQ